MTTNNTRNIKIALIGDSGVGKSSIALRYTSNQFDVNYLSTNGAAYSTKIIEKYGETLQLDIWDTAGQERYRSLGKNFYKDAFIVILVYDITKPQTFVNLKEIWYDELEKNGEEKPILGIAGNKNDQYENDNIVNEEEARNFANSVNGIFQLVSAKTGDNIENFFNMLINEYFKLNYPEKIQKKIDRRNSYQISYKKNKNNNNNNINGSNQVKKSKCC